MEGISSFNFFWIAFAKILIDKHLRIEKRFSVPKILTLKRTIRKILRNIELARAAFWVCCHGRTMIEWTDPSEQGWMSHEKKESCGNRE